MRTARISLLLAALLVTGGCGSSSSTPPPPPPCLCGGTCAADGSCVACDGSLTLDSANPADAASALGICRNLVSAHWVQPDGSPPPAGVSFDLGHGILPSFGSNVTPQEGSRLLALSTGTARRPSDPGYVAGVTGLDKGYASGLPAGFPAAVPACAGQFLGGGFDGVGLEVTLTVPTGAAGLAIDYKFYSSDWPDFVCSNFNDQFIIRLSPPPPTQPDGNLALDLQGGPVGPYPSFIDECSCTGLCVQGGLDFLCGLGTAGLVGTGFEAGAASSWRTATAAVRAGDTVALRFAIWDSGDGSYDSTVLLDHFRWTR